MITLIEEEKLKPNETCKFLQKCFREGKVKTTGTDIDRLLLPVSGFGSLWFILKNIPDWVLFDLM